MAENFTTYTEEDPNSRISKTSSRVTWTSITRNETAYVYKDKTADFFDGDFTHYLTINTTAVNTDNIIIGVHWALANTLDSWWDLKGASGDELSLYIDHGANMQLNEIDGGSVHSTGVAYTPGTILYLKIVRDESAGDYGTLYCYIYSDADRTNLLNTLTLTLHSSKKDFRYIYAFQSYGGTSDTGDISGYTENLDLLGDLPTVTTQAMSDITTITATGNGNVTDLGDADVTQYGHCWNTTGTPTTSDNKTEKGAKATTGAFTSVLSRLTHITLYRVRTYVTNSIGTSYGNEVSFTTTSGASGLGGGVGGVGGVPSATGISFPIGERLLVEERVISKPMAEAPMTDIETLAFNWLTRKGIEFQFQTSLMGGFYQLGGAVVDFLIPSRNLAWRIFGEYWHRGVVKEGSDVLQRETLIAIGWTVVDILGDNILNRLEETLSKALRGEEML